MEPAVLWLGSRSYSLYLVHSVASRVAWEVRDRILVRDSTTGTFLVAGTAVLFTFGEAEVNYRFLEMPLRRLGRRVAAGLARRQVVDAPGTT